MCRGYKDILKKIQDLFYIKGSFISYISFLLQQMHMIRLVKMRGKQISSVPLCMSLLLFNMNHDEEHWYVNSRKTIIRPHTPDDDGGVEKKK